MTLPSGMENHTADNKLSMTTQGGGAITRGQNAILRLVNLRAVDIPWKEGKVSRLGKAGSDPQLPGQAFLLTAPIA